MYPFKPCKCLLQRLAIRRALREALGELKELAEARTLKEVRDESSDVMFALGRLMGSVSGRLYVRLPGVGSTEAKMASRIQHHGCVRSERNYARLGCGT